jgi:hypothetical protein
MRLQAVDPTDPCATKQIYREFNLTISNRDDLDAINSCIKIGSNLVIDKILQTRRIRTSSWLFKHSALRRKPTKRRRRGHGGGGREEEHAAEKEEAASDSGGEE